MNKAAHGVPQLGLSFRLVLIVEDYGEAVRPPDPGEGGSHAIGGRPLRGPTVNFNEEENIKQAKHITNILLYRHPTL